MAARRRPVKARRRPQRDGVLAWIGTLLVGVVLIAGGFGTGVLFGVVTEEPAALASYWTGRSERVALAEGAEGEALADRVSVAASRDAAAAASPGGLVAEAVPRAGRDSLPAVSAPPSGFAVQVGAFSSSEAARAMKTKLEAGGYASYVAAGAASQDRRWRVRVGPFSSRDAADRAAERLERGEGLSTWVVSLDDGG
jgi:hypothetical protein